MTQLPDEEKNKNSLFDPLNDENALPHRFMDLFPGIVYIYDPLNKKLRYISKQVTELLGYSFEDIASWDNDFMKMIFAEDVDKVKAELDKYALLQNEDSHSYQTRFNHKNGDWRYFRTKGTVLRRSEDGKPSSLFFLAQDVTDQVKTSEELQKLNEVMNETQHMLDFGIFNWDLGKDAMLLSPPLVALFDAEDSSKTKTISYKDFLDTIFNEDRKRINDIIQKAINTKTSFEAEYGMITWKNEEKIVLIKGKVVTDDKDNITKIVGSISNFTRIRLFERELQYKIEELDRSNKELEEFAYVASHDLQEPLRKIQTFCDRLRTKYGTELGEEGKVYVQRMIASAEIMRELIDNLLEFSRISRNGKSFSKIDLNTVIKEIIREQNSMNEDRITINIGKLPVIEANTFQAKQLFNNLLNNALKFSQGEKNPMITITANEPLATDIAQFNLPSNKKYYRLEVTDNGIGFDQEFAERIFQIFQRLHGKAEYPGSGIGLAIAKKIVENHEGFIYAKGQPGEGATFVILLPESQY